MEQKETPPHAYLMEEEKLYVITSMGGVKMSATKKKNQETQRKQKPICFPNLQFLHYIEKYI